VLRHLRDRPMRVRLRADGGRATRHLATGIIVGNVGWLQGGLPLLPDAKPDDGLLDVVVLTAHGWTSWLLLSVLVLLRREASRVLRRTFRELRVDVSREVLWELDGEVMGKTRHLVIALHESKLRLRVPTEGDL